MFNPPQHQLDGLGIGVGILLTDGFEPPEMTGPCAPLEESGVLIGMLPGGKVNARAALKGILARRRRQHIRGRSDDMACCAGEGS